MRSVAKGELVRCSNCGSDNESGRKFCGECGSALALICGACGSTNLPGNKFCGECGSALSLTIRPPVSVAVAPAPAEGRRWVTVLFADLVGFTPFSEGRDSEEVRDFLTGYFAEARSIIERYAGTVDKFIGDAVMAVWGAVYAQEDDAERAVRAGLDLVDAVSKLGAEAGVPELAVRVGVLSGEAAVGIGGNELGMVVGDLVNTASRLQSVAPAGTVLVGEPTYRIVGRAIACEPLGIQQLKGKTTPVPAWRAVRVVAKLGGAGRPEGIEGPFVGREEEFRLLKDQLHAAGREGRSRLVSVTGIGGIGKSRLIWEFLKYIDGLAEVIYWHEGRSPAYGEGLTFWALGEMVRRRAGIAELESDTSSMEKLAATLIEYVDDPEIRRWIEPRMAGLLGLEAMAAGQQAEVFAAWRAFFEAVSTRGTTVLVFEDLQWADPGLLDFVEQLPDWSRDRPILVVTLARPELLDRRPTWGSGRRNFVSVHLGPLADPDMMEMLAGMTPGLPDSTTQRIVDRAAGIPLYAVETVRMLLADGTVVAEGDRYRLARELAELAIPESLQAVIGARLDQLDQPDITLVQAASVLGQVFSVDGLSSLLHHDPQQLTDRLADLVRRELVFLDADPRSPERGQYSFVQPLIREVAYARLGLRERRARHLEVARFMESLDDPEIAGAVANHYLAAYQAGSSGDESSDLAASALAALITAADRAASLHSHRQAFFYLEQALTVAPDEPTRAGLWERAGAAALAINDQDLAEQHAQRALDSYRLCGDRPGLARAAVLLARHFFSAGRPEQGLDVLTAVVDEVGQGEDAATASLLAELARGNMLVLNYAGAAQVAEQALSVAEALELEPVVIEALNTRGTSLGSLGRHQEAVALLSHALRLADGTGNIQSAIRARNNLGYTLNPDDPKETYRYMREAMDLARRVGLRGAEVFHLRGAIDSALTMGDWEWILGVVEEARRRGFADSEVAELEAGGPIQIRAFRGDPAGAEEAAETDMRFLEDVTDPQALAWRSNMRGWLAMAAGRLADAGRHGLEALEMDPIIEHAAPALFAALLMRDQAKMIEMAAALDNLKIRGRVVGAMRTLARGALLHPSEEATGLLTGATRTFRDLDLHLYLGMSLACAAVLLAGRDPWAVEARVEAESVFDSLEASSLRRLLEDCLARPLIGTGAATSD